MNLVTEAGIVAASLTLLMLAQIALARAWYLFTRNFWLDELYTYAIAADPDAHHALRAAGAGFDANPPALPILLRSYSLLAGRLTEVRARVYTFATTVTALAGVYVLLRQSFPPLVAFVGTLAVWAHPLTMFHAFEARCYGTWLAAIVWFAYFLSRSGGELGLGIGFGLACASVLVCTAHYFGIISLVLVISGELLLGRAIGWLDWPTLILAGLGAAALVACLPILRRQRAAYTVGTWINPATARAVIKFGRDLMPRYMGVAVAVAWLSYLTCGPQGDGLHDGSALVGVTALGLMPLVLIAFSYLAQPALEDRYTIPAVAALGPAAAFVMVGADPWWLVTLGAFLLGAGVPHLRGLSDWYRERDRQTAALIESIRRDTGDGPVLFESPHELNVVCHYAPDLAPRCFGLDFEPGQIGGVDGFRVFTRDAMRAFAHYFPQVGMMTWGKASQWPRFYVVHGRRAHRADLPEPAKAYPAFTPRPLGNGLFEMVGTGP